MTSTRSSAGTRERILEIAERLFHERGFSGTSIRDIAEELGTTKAALYYHFPGKEDILEALLEPIGASVRTLVDTAVREKRTPEQVVRALVALVGEHAPLLRILANDPAVAHMVHDDQDDVNVAFERLHDYLAGPRASAARNLKVYAALGVIQGTVLGAMSPAGSRRGVSLPLTSAQTEQLVQIVLATLA